MNVRGHKLPSLIMCMHSLPSGTIKYVVGSHDPKEAEMACLQPSRVRHVA